MLYYYSGVTKDMVALIVWEEGIDSFCLEHSKTTHVELSRMVPHIDDSILG